MNTPDSLPYATPAQPRPGKVRRWLSRRAATSGPRLIAFSVLALVGVLCMSPNQNNVLLYDWGDRLFRISLGLFAFEYVLSLFH